MKRQLAACRPTMHASRGGEDSSKHVQATQQYSCSDLVCWQWQEQASLGVTPHLRLCLSFLSTNRTQYTMHVHMKPSVTQTRRSVHHQRCSAPRSSTVTVAASSAFQPSKPTLFDVAVSNNGARVRQFHLMMDTLQYWFAMQSIIITGWPHRFAMSYIPRAWTVNMTSFRLRLLVV
jgi:hypothetical protein